MEMYPMRRQLKDLVHTGSWSRGIHDLSKRPVHLWTILPQSVSIQNLLTNKQIHYIWVILWTFIG